MNRFYCCVCRKEIPKYSRADARYCSDYCRKLGYDIRKGRSRPQEQKQGVVGVGK